MGARTYGRNDTPAIPGYCIKGIWKDWDSRQCNRRAKYGDYCGIHSPEKKAARDAKRGPTKFERDCAAIEKERARILSIEAENATLRARVAELEAKNA